MRILKEEKEFRVYGFGRKKCPNNYRGRRRTKDTIASSPREKETKRSERSRRKTTTERDIARERRERATTETKKSLLFKKKSDRILSLSLSQ